MTWLGPCRKVSPGGGALTWQSGLLAATAIKVLAGHLLEQPVQSLERERRCKKAARYLSGANLESLGQAARRSRVTSHPRPPATGTPHAVSAFRRSQHQ